MSGFPELESKMTYTVVNDAMPLGATSSVASLINASGETAGEAGGIPGMQATAVEWSPTGAATVLTDLGYEYVYVSGINASGEVLGYGYNAPNDGGAANAVLWAPGGASATILQDVGGQGQSEAWALNDAGDSTGFSFIGDGGRFEAVYWDAAGAPVVLASLGNSSAGFTADEGTCINNAGVIGGFSNNEAVEWSNNGSILWHDSNVSAAGSAIYAINASGDAIGSDNGQAVYWSPTGQETVLAEPNPGVRGAHVYAINAAGDSVGLCGSRAILWADTGAATVLADLPGTTRAEAAAVNGRDQSVGYEIVDRKEVATAWTKTGVVTNLNLILGHGWSETEASEINSVGDICGSGIHKDAQSAWELLWVPNASAPDGGTYVNADNHNALAAAAIHPIPHTLTVGDSSF